MNELDWFALQQKHFGISNRIFMEEKKAHDYIVHVGQYIAPLEMNSNGLPYEKQIEHGHSSILPLASIRALATIIIIIIG